MTFRFTLAASVALLCAFGFGQTTRLVPSQYPTIQTAINASVNSDTVLVAPGTYAGSVNFSGKTITVASSGGSTVTTLLGAAGVTVVTFQGGEGPATSLQGFRVTGGAVGIYCHNAAPQILNCRIDSNHAPAQTGAAAAGIRCLVDAGNSSPAITACTISQNTSFRGGGLSFETAGAGQSSPTISGCAIFSNVAAYDPNAGQLGGGGLYVSGAINLLISATSVTDNLSHTGGGGILANATTLTVDRCVIRGNHAIEGAALSTNSTPSTITGTLIADNVNTSTCIQCGAQGPIQLGGNTTFQSCTITNNQSAALAGGIAFSGTMTLNLIDTILWGNNGLDLYRYPFNNPVAIASYSDIGITNVPLGPTSVFVDPLFIDPAGGDFHLSSSSPCKNAGAPGAVGLPSLDLDGTPRVVGGTVDIGADEIPVLSFPGTTDGLDLYAQINGTGDPLASVRSAAVGSLLSVHMKSTTGSLVGGLPLFAARMYFTGNSFPVPGGGIWMDGQSIIVYGSLSAPPFGFPGLSADGLHFDFTVPAGLAGQTVRMQGLVTSVDASNGVYATSNATEVTF